MYEITICPLKKLYQFAAEGDMSEVAVLAVSSYEIRKDKLTGFCAQLYMCFSDIVDVNNPNSFDANTAEKIADFIRTLPGNLDTLFVCCDSGESRSTAMAAAIMKYTGKDEMKVWKNPHYRPNPLVYSLLCKALGIDVPRETVTKLCEINNNTFKLAKYLR